MFTTLRKHLCFLNERGRVILQTCFANVTVILDLLVNKKELKITVL